MLLFLVPVFSIYNTEICVFEGFVEKTISSCGIIESNIGLINRQRKRNDGDFDLRREKR